MVSPPGGAGSRPGDPAGDAVGDVAAARAAVVATAGRMVDDGLVVGTSGNVSARVGDLVAVTPSGVDYRAMTADDVVVVDLAGAVVEGTLRPTSELPLHRVCHGRAGVGAVVHTHSTAAVALSLHLDALPRVHYQTAMFGGAVRVADYHPFGSPELAAAVDDALADRTAAILRHHGTVVVAPTLAAAYDGARQLEWMCDVWLRAAALGPARAAPRELTAEQVAEIVGRMADYGQSGR